MTVTDKSMSVNGVRGGMILYNYLDSIGMEGNVGGHSGNGIYEWFIAEDIHPKSTLTPDDPAFWD